ncbi:MAG: CPBP family intramembrane glutamic endopeptidase, partial [Deltaproteobacteria bacterium]
LAALVAFGLWHKLDNPQFDIVDLSVDRRGAVAIAETYLKTRGIDPQKFIHAVAFENDQQGDAYLQKVLGLRGEKEFSKRQEYEFFYWRVRFFKELKKEEYDFKISPASGFIINFKHLIDDIEPRETLAKDAALQKARDFFVKAYGLNMQDYDFNEEKTKRYEHRLDYTFSWEKKNAYIPWGKDEGVAKLLATATVAGSEITEFYKNKLEPPEKFKRYFNNNLILAEYLYSLYMILFTLLVGLAASIMIMKRHVFDMAITKKWFINMGVFLFIANIAYVFNILQTIIIKYQTMSKLSSFIGLYLTRIGTYMVLFNVIFIVPALAGEALHAQSSTRNKYASFSYYVRTGLFNRGITRTVVFGYLLFFIFLGVQAVIFYLGQKYLGVWKEWIRLTEFSSAYLLFFSAFVIGLNAGIGEELTFRLFGINFFKVYFKNTALAVVLTAFIWGLGHSGYAIFPVWFRILEVGILGLIYGSLYIRYGIISLIIAHYLFDVFWGSAPHLLGHSSLVQFVGAVAVMALPLLFAFIAYVMNRQENEREVKIMLNKTQEYNLNILINFVNLKHSQGVSPGALRDELLSHNWDPALVDLAIKQTYV